MLRERSLRLPIKNVNLIRLSFTILLSQFLFLSSDAQSRFAKTYDFGTAEVYGELIESENGNLILSGSGNYDSSDRIILSKISQSGELVDSAIYSFYGLHSSTGSGDPVTQIDDKIYQVGWTHDGLDHGYIFCFDENLDSIWVDTIRSNAIFFTVKPIGDSVLLICGRRVIQIDSETVDLQSHVLKYRLGSGVVWSSNYGEPDKFEWAYDLEPLPNGNIFISGFKQISNNNIDPFIYVLDSQGAVLKEELIELSEYEDAPAVVHLKGNRAYVAVDLLTDDVSSFEPSKIWVTKFDLNGDSIWTRQFGKGSIHHGVRDIKSAEDGTILVTGQTTIVNEFNPLGSVIGYILRMDTNGEELSMDYFKVFPEEDSLSQTHYVRSLVATSDGGYAISGFIQGTFPQDLFIVKFDSNGCYRTDVPCQVGVEEFIESEEIRHYPNPFQDRITIETKTKVDLSIYNISGQLLVERLAISPGISELTGFDFPAGFYILQIQPFGGTSRRSVIVKE